MNTAKKIKGDLVFTFDDHSLETVEELESKGVHVETIEMDEATIYLPEQKVK